MLPKLLRIGNNLLWKVDSLFCQVNFFSPKFPFPKYKRKIWLKSSGSGKKRDLHFNLPVPVAKDLIRKPIDNNFKISLVTNWCVSIYLFPQNLENSLLARWLMCGLFYFNWSYSNDKSLFPMFDMSLFGWLPWSPGVSKKFFLSGNVLTISWPLMANTKK